MISGIDDLSQFRGSGIFLITYGLLSQKDSPYANVIAKGEAFDLTILDEAAAVKNSSANRTKTILGKMLPKLGYVLPLSGTPAPNHAGELYPVLKALWPKAINASGTPMTEYQFQDAFCRVVRKRFGGGPEVRVIEGSKNLSELRKRMDGFMVRIMKEDVLRELPAIRYDLVPLAVDRVSAAISPEIPAGLSDEELLRYLAGAGDEHIMKLRRHLGLTKAVPAVEYLKDFLDNLPPGRKLLVFAHHRDVIDILARGLAGWDPAVITGASSPRERADSVDRFLGSRNCRVFVGNIQASGTGLTLVGPECRCSDVVFVEASYSVGDNVQAACRVHRIGQHEAVVARFLTAHGTIDDRIQDILSRKARDFAQLFN
jgi:SWI/SNF-related matrix-associated actin-dependent regulator 1 of chromatin subfamily A